MNDLLYLFMIFSRSVQTEFSRSTMKKSIRIQSLCNSSRREDISYQACRISCWRDPCARPVRVEEGKQEDHPGNETEIKLIIGRSRLAVFLLST